MIAIAQTIKKLPLFIALVSFTSLLIAVSFGGPTYAANMITPPAVDTKIQNFLLNRAVNYCFRDAGLSGGIGIDQHQRITPDAIDSGDWFASGLGSNAHEAVTGPYLADTRFNLPNNQTEKTNCGTKAMVSLYLKASGNSAVNVLCNSNFVRSDGSPCTNGNGDLKMKGDYNATAKAFHDKHPEPKMDDESWYWFYRKTFNWSCGYGKMTSGVISEKEYDAQKTDDKYGYRLLYVTDNKEDKVTLNGKEITNAKFVYITGYKKRADNVQTRNGEYPGFAVVNKSCKEIQSLIEDYGQKYAASTSARPVSDIEKEQDGLDSTGTGGEGESTCGIQGVGWLVCPLMSFLGDIATNSFNFISDKFLETRIDTITNSAIVSAWSAIRNIANIAFVIVFLIIIFSQLTGQGVTNYGVKKMLPRLIIAAILMNLSLFICQIAVDVSNILGGSLNSFISGIYTGASVGGGDAAGNAGGIAVIVAASILAGATLLLAITGPVLLAVLIAVLMIVLILVARMALIVVLIVVAPLAFVAYLLPNTEQWFKRWWKMFAAILLVYPIIAVVFGASTLASKVINAGAGDDMTMQLVAVGVAAIPLFVVPSLLKGSMSAAGSIGAKLSNMGDKATGRIGKKYGETSKLAAYNKARQTNSQIKRAQITGGTYKGRNPFARASSAMNSSINASGITGTMGTKVAQQAAALSNKLQTESIEAANAQIKQANINNTDLAKIANGGTSNGINGKDAATRASAMLELGRRGDFKTLESSWNGMLGDTSKGSGETRKVVAQAFAGSSDRPGFMGQGVLGQVARSEVQKDPATGAVTDSYANKTFQSLAAENGAKYSAQKIATTPKDELGYVLDQQARHPGGVQRSFVDAAHEALNNEQIKTSIGDNRAALEMIDSTPSGRP